MNIKFENPCPNGTPEGTSFLNKSKLKFTTKSGDNIVSPYEGKVTKTPGINPTNNSAATKDLHIY